MALSYGRKRKIYFLQATVSGRKLVSPQSPWGFCLQGISQLGDQGMSVRTELKGAWLCFCKQNWALVLNSPRATSTLSILMLPQVAFVTTYPGSWARTWHAWQNGSDGLLVYTHNHDFRRRVPGPPLQRHSPIPHGVSLLSAPTSSLNLHFSQPTWQLSALFLFPASASATQIYSCSLGLMPSQ